MTPTARRPVAGFGERALITIIIACGVALTITGFVYLLEPASSLPDFFPGRDDRSSRHLVAFGIVSALLGFEAFGLAAFLPDAWRRGASRW
ncbi:MAG TPA: hypothetical protein VGO31_15410 [Microbacteriaceae bacterium]|jgi:hypothetical protein|nr:hypothetical protein [Microbacteriaceae bacterium]